MLNNEQKSDLTELKVFAAAKRTGQGFSFDFESNATSLTFSTPICC